MNLPYAVFVGDVALDEFFRASRWPAAPGTKIDLFPLETRVGGMIANAAVVYAALGDKASLMWTMNGSELSHRLLEELNARGVSTGLVAHDPQLADSRNIIILTDDEHTVMTPALGSLTIEVDALALSLLRDAQYVYTAIGDLRSMRQGPASAADVMDAVREGGARIALDLDVANVTDSDDDLIGRTDILLMNRTGFERYCDGRSPEKVVAGLLAGGVSMVIVTLAADGCRVIDGARDVSVPGLSVPVVDVTGAGDTFGAAFLHALNLTGDPVPAAQFANAAAARAVTAIGARAGATSHAEVVAFMTAHGVRPDPRLLDSTTTERQSHV